MTRPLTLEDTEARASGRGGREPFELAARVRMLKTKSVAVADGTTEEWQDPRTGEVRQREAWFWLPLSQVKVLSGSLAAGQLVTIVIPEWLAKAKGLA